LGAEEEEAVLRVLRSGWLAAGKETEAFEREFSAYISSDHSIFTNCCTSALKMSYKLLKEWGFSGISYPLNTFCATYSAASEIGLDLFPDLCQNVGVKEIICQELKLFVSGVEKSIGTGQLITLGSVQGYVSTSGKEDKECPKVRSSKKGTSQKNRLSKYDKAILMSNGIILPILGSDVTGGKLQNAKCVELHLETTQSIKDTLLGLTKTSNTQETEKTGNSFVVSATSTMIIAKVNVHFGGKIDSSPCLIEDSAHRIEPNDPLVGKIRCYSFYATKNMTTGSGGMLVTNDKEIYETCRIYWRDGLSSTTSERSKGNYNYRVLAMAGGYDGNDLAAAIGRCQLKKLPEFTRRRNEIVKYYNGELRQTWKGNHLYPYMLESEGQVPDFIQFMRNKGITCGYHYPNTGFNGVSLPLYPSLTDEEIKYIIKSVKEWQR